MAVDGLQKRDVAMPVDKSLFYYGPVYHRLLDLPLAEAREVIVGLIKEGSSVLAMACGTGQLCFALRDQKHCHVVSLDLSLRMLEFARNASPFQDVTFVHEDAIDLRAFENNSFD